MANFLEFLTASAALLEPYVSLEDYAKSKVVACGLWDKICELARLVISDDFC